MELLMMVAAVSILGMVVTLGLFAVATGGRLESNEQPAAAASRAAVRLQPSAAATAMGPAMFFLDRAADTERPPVPIEVLLLQIERHVRLEQAAAESFLHAPTVQSLHTRTTSPLLH